MHADIMMIKRRVSRISFPGLSIFLLVAIVVIVVAELLFQPRFGTYQNIVNVTRMTALLVLVSVGQMFVIVVRGFDLSIGAVMASTSIAVAASVASIGHQDSYLATSLLALVVAIGFGMIIGAANGLLVTALNVHAFIVTLGTSSVVTGIALWLTNGVPIYGLPKSFIDGFGRSNWWSVPSFVWIAAITLLLLAVLYDQSFIGKYIKAAGRDQRASELSGIRTRNYIVLAYAISGACAAIAALLLTAQLGSGQASIGTVYAFQSIAVCIIAGVGLMGGKGKIINVVLAALFLQLLNNGFELFRVASQVQVIVAGAIVIGVALVTMGKRES